MNCVQESHDIYEDTCLHPGILADLVSDEYYPEYPNPREIFSQKLEDRVISEYRENPELRKSLQACHKNFWDNFPEGAAESARDQLLQTMKDWIKEIIQTTK